jgi:protein ImuB
MRLPRDGLGRRFGGELLAFLDRALGRCPDPRAFWSPPPQFQRRMDLAVESVDRSLLLEAAQRLLHELAGFLRARSSAACAVELELAHQGVPSTRLLLELASPSCDPQHLLELIGERLEHLPLEHEVFYLGMRVQRLQQLQPEMGDLYSRRGRPAEGDHCGQQTRRRAQLLVERLGARLGEDAVRVLESVADHRPERSSAETPWHLAAVRDGELPHPSPGAPVWLLPRPLALQGGHAPASLDGPLEVEHGPRRIESGWWDGDDVARDYYVARSSRGTRYWIFRECRKPERWFVHGIFA